MKTSTDRLVVLGLLAIPLIVTLIFLFYLSQPAQPQPPTPTPAASESGALMQRAQPQATAGTLSALSGCTQWECSLDGRPVGPTPTYHLA